MSINYTPIHKQEGHDGPVSLHWLIHEIHSYQALQYLGIGLKHRSLTRTKIGSHSSYVKHQEDFERLHHMKPCKTCNPWQSIRPWGYNLHLFVIKLDKATCKIW